MAHHFLLGYMNTTSPIIKGFKDGESLLADMEGENGGEGKVRSMVTNNTVGFNWYSQSGQMASQLQSFDPANSEIYNLSSGMEMMVGFPIKNMVVGGGAWVEEVEEDEQSLRRVVSTNNEMAINTQQKGLSLSLSSSNNPIGFHSFDDGLRFLGKQENLSHPFASEDQFFHVRSSKYLGPAQELLKEFCCVGTTQSHHYPSNRNAQWQDNNGSSQNHSLLGSLDFLELQKRKSKLFHLLDEVDRGYKHYRDQMTAVVLSFEAVAGNGAAMVYSAMAARVMSRHFRRLKDAILAQVKETKKAMTEKETMAGPGATKGETPRLKIIDQTLRQQKAFQQLTMMDSHPWRPQRGLPERSVSVLRAWLFEHFLHPYPSDVDKHILARQTGLSRSQVSNWFINARVRLWKPMVEEMYLEEVKEHDNIPGSSEGAGRERLDKKPNLVRLDNYSECISSILNIPEKNQPRAAGGDHHHRHFGAVELDFSSYTGGEKKTGGGVSLSLGLPQHGGSGVGLAFTSTSSNSLFYPREQIEECQTVQYTVLENEGQNLPYRNLMGSQLLHDLAG